MTSGANAQRVRPAAVVAGFRGVDCGPKCQGISAYPGAIMITSGQLVVPATGLMHEPHCSGFVVLMPYALLKPTNLPSLCLNAVTKLCTLAVLQASPM